MLGCFGCDLNRRALVHCVFWSLVGRIPVQQRTSGTEEGWYIANKTKYTFIDFFHALEIIYNVVINNGVYCVCLGKCDRTLSSSSAIARKSRKYYFSRRMKLEKIRGFKGTSAINLKVFQLCHLAKISACSVPQPNFSTHSFSMQQDSNGGSWGKDAFYSGILNCSLWSAWKRDSPSEPQSRHGRTSSSTCKYFCQQKEKLYFSNCKLLPQL